MTFLHVPEMQERVFTQSIPGVEIMFFPGAVKKTVALLVLVIIGVA
ncbi:MAG: hypothetical protein ACWGOL_03115 [Desulfuromonadales bacterium]